MSVFFENQEPGQDQGARHAEPTHEGQSPLLLHDMQSPEEAFGVPPRRRHSQQAVVAVLLVVGAVGCIFAMRQFGLGPARSLAGINIDYKPEANTSGVSAKQVLADLERSRKAVQVPADHIKHDPFELATDTGAGEITEDPGALNAAEAARRAEAARLAREQHDRDVTAAFEKLTLQSVMEGSVPVARISDTIVKVGMTVGEYFVVTAIEGRDVTLTADGKSYTLSLDSARSDGPRANPKGKR